MRKLNFRKIHKCIGLIVFLPFLIILLTGIALHFRNNVFQFEIKNDPLINIEDSKSWISVEKAIEVANENKIKNIKLVSFRNNKIIMRTIDDYEIELDARNGKTLKIEKKISLFLNRIHQNLFLDKFFGRILSILTGILLIILLFTGLKLYKWKKK